MRPRTIHYPDIDSNDFAYVQSQRPTLCGIMVNSLDAPFKVPRSEWSWGVNCKRCIRSSDKQRREA